MDALCRFEIAVGVKRRESQFKLERQTLGVELSAIDDNSTFTRALGELL